VRPGSFSKASAISVTLGILVILGGFLWSQANHTTVRPAPSVASGGTHSGSTPSSAPAGQDIGLAAHWCDLGTLGGLNLLGNGTKSTAWTGYPVNNEGKCLGNNPKWRVAVDVTGDGRADAESGPIKWCSDTGCAPLGASDLDADGDQELVIHTNFTIVDHLYFSVRRLSGGGFSLDPIVVAAPGNPAAGIQPGVPLITSASGDAGYSSWMRCEGFPQSPILVWTVMSSVVESKQPVDWHETKLQLREAGGGPPMFYVVATNDFKLPPNQDPGLIRSTKPACDLDFNIWVPPN
jgi:hypothetical protein